MSDPYCQTAITHLAQILGCPEADLSPEDTISTVSKWDSLNHMRLILQLEETLGHQIETDDTLSLFSVEGIADYLRKNTR